MHTEKEHIDPDELAAMGYERRDVNVKMLGKTVGIFYAFAIVSALFAAFILYWGVNVWFIKIDPYVVRTTTQEKNEAVNRAGRLLPQSPNPLLQGNVTAKLDLQTMRQAEDARLNGTGYADESRSKAFIPINRAMDLLAQRGLPKTNSEAAVSRGNNMEPFGTGTVPAPDRIGAQGDTTLGTPNNAVPTPSNTAPTNTTPPVVNEPPMQGTPVNPIPAQTNPPTGGPTPSQPSQAPGG
ncbi:hypothetical protein EON79_11400 [bacterium]|nr:MAG: hypothetical protein EON79_11400 [bacterium]